MPVETELKLTVANITAAELDAQPVVREHARAGRHERHLGTVYFDTPDLRLQAAGIGLRLRRDGEQWLQAIKTSGAGSGGLHRRDEWEMPVAGEALEPQRFDAAELRGLFDDGSVSGALQPVFRTDFHRSTWDLDYPDGTRIELALDLGDIVARDRQEAISEIELELVHGDVAWLFEAASALAGSLPARVQNASKAERGYRLGGYAGAPLASKAGPVGLEPGASAEQAFVYILHHGLAHLQGNEPVLLENPDDPEGVHQMRVATRRMRSCLKLFRPLVPRQASGPVAADIKWVTDALGPARDWDVFIGETLQPLGREFPRHRALAELEQAARRQRAAAYLRATESLRSCRYTQLLLDLGLWLERRPWRTGADPASSSLLDAPAARFAAEDLAKRHRQVIKRGERFGQMDPAERHELRIRCKGLRYASEFFASLYDESRPAEYSQAVAGLQDALGALNDAHVVHDLLDQIQPGGTPAGADVVYGWTAANTRCHLDGFEAAWAAFEVAPQFWA